MAKSAAAYKRKSGFLFHSDSETTDGVWIASPPFISLDDKTSVIELGETILKVISSSKTNVEHPTDWKSINKNLFDLAGVKSLSSFMNRIQCCTIEELDGIISVIPNRNLGAKEGFVPINEKKIMLKSISNLEDIGKALLNGFDLCD